jgi:zinc protease
VLLALAACGGSRPKPTAPAPGPTVAKTAPTPAATPAVAPNPDAQPLPLWPEVHKGVLPNGLTYYIFKHGKPEKRALLWLAVNAGSVQEDDDQRGLAHFDEHMAFNGTKRYPKNQLIAYLESIGMRFGADLNAHTSWDETVFNLEVPTDKPELIGKGLDILRDWAHDVTYDPAEIGKQGTDDKERGVVLSEWRLGRGAGTRLFDKQAPVLFAGTRYADRITIGLPEIIKSAPPAALVRFYKDWYRPDLMAVIAVGDFDVPTVEKEIKARFGDIPVPGHERARPDGGVPPATGTRVSIEISNLVPHRPELSKLDYRRLIAEELYTSILDERLDILSRSADAPFISAGGSIGSLVRTVDGFSRFATAKDGKVEDTLRALLREVTRLERFGVTQTELDRARANIKRFYEESADTESTHDSREFAEEITRNFMAQELMVGREAEKQLTLSLLPTITTADFDQIAKNFGGAANRVFLISGPEGKSLPTKERVLAIADEVAKEKLEPWQDKPPASSLMAKAPTPGKIVKEKTIPSIGVTVWTLSNGARVVVKPTDYEVDSVSIVGSSPGGDALAPDKELDDARFADDVVELGGVGNLDAVALSKVLAGKQVSVGTDIGETTEAIEAAGSVRDLETMMQLIYLRVTAPREDKQQFAVWQANAEEQLTNALRSPEVQFARDATAEEWKHALRRLPATADDIKKVDLDKAFAFYRNRFSDVSDFTFVIVGAVDLAKLRPLVETYLASLPGHGRKEHEKDLHLRKIAGVVKKEWKLGQEPKATVELDFNGPETWTRDKERDMAILGQVLSMRLRYVLREKLGGVYGVGASGFISRTPYQARTFTIRFGCRPERVNELIKATFDTIDELAKHGTDGLEEDGKPFDYLSNIKETYLRTRETEMRKNAFWADWLERAYRYGDDPTLILDPSHVLARMTSKDVQAAAKHYLDAHRYFQAVLLPAK